MGSKRITREELKRLKRKRQRHLNTVVTLVVSASMIVVLAVSVIVFNDRPSDAEYGGQMHVGVKNDLGTGDLPVMATPIDASSEEEQTTEQTTEAKTTEEESTEYDVEFEVPETSLPPVEEVVGNDWYPGNYEKVEKVAPLSYFDDTVLIGDSRTEGIVLYSGLSNLNAFCYKGLNVSKLDSEACITLPEYGGKYTCYQAIEYTSFDNYYCMFGINELGWYDMDIFVEDFSALVDYIKSVNPNANIYVESVMPVSKSKENQDAVFTKENVDEINSLLLDMCKKRKDCVFLDVGAAVRDEDGYLPEEGSPDGIHCNADYCKRVLQYIRCNRYEKK
ncbi:MAG: GDSL-type esterase/lipase family protein [Clostridium sp.]|nr:GDSL-type esterase/lipase family protein [Clostridium sp.]MCM1400179.1 GDSL-type esterase/lipase family protein [Clostridium sp.]MCM1460911.1 GDSL-type esterase/lipase family protein [Bacteroides sp.]